MSFSSDQPLVSNQLPNSISLPEVNDKAFIEMLSNHLRRISDVVNTKEGSLYLLNEIATFQQFFTANNPQQNRNSYRKVFDLVQLNGGVIGAGATVVFPHNITGLFNTGLIYASCTSSTSIFFTVVYPDVFLDAVNVNFTHPLGVTLTQAIVVAEYLKN